jgi:signal transduction histidine kinase
MVKCTIQDNGPGISSEKLRKLFAFLKTDKKGGHGLGLFVCQEIITRHEGTISVASQLGKGTTFTISLLPANAGAKQR